MNPVSAKFSNLHKHTVALELTILLGTIYRLITDGAKIIIVHIIAPNGEANYKVYILMTSMTYLRTIYVCATDQQCPEVNSPLV